MEIIIRNTYGKHIVESENYLTLFEDGSGEIKDRLGNPILKTQFDLRDGNTLTINGITFPLGVKKEMTTAERRTKFLETEPVLLDFILRYLEEGKYRDIETDCLCDKGLSDPDLKDYVITLLCDELIKLTNDNESEEEEENPYLLTGEELERAVRSRIAGRKI